MQGKVTGVNNNEEITWAFVLSARCPGIFCNPWLPCKAVLPCTLQFSISECG